MGTSNDVNILNLLKEKYKDKVESLLKSNSSSNREIEIVRVTGEAMNMAAVSDCGGAVSSNALYAKAKAADMPATAEFRVVPGELYSVFNYGYKEVQASKNGGAYERVTGVKAFCAAEALRKVMGKCAFGRGYGELTLLGTTNAATLAAASAGDSIILELPISTVMGLARNMDLVIKTSVADSTEQVILTVEKINGKKVTVRVGTGAYASAVATDVLCYRGSMDDSGNPNLPIGWAGWNPIVGARVEGTALAPSAWDTYIATPFYGRDRSKNIDGEAGGFYYDSNNTTYKADIQGAMIQARILGNDCDFIILNPLDFLKLDNEISTTNTYFTATSTRAKKNATVGFNKFAASFSTNYVDMIYDDAFCPEGEFYIETKKFLKIWAYTKADMLIHDGVEGNNPGKQSPEAFENKGNEDKNYKLLIDDILTVESGDYTRSGASVRCTYNFLGTFVIENPSASVHGLFHDADTTILASVSA